MGPLCVQIRLIALKDELFDIEMETVDALAELISEFDRNYSEISEGNKANFSAFFGQVGGGTYWAVSAEAPVDGAEIRGIRQGAPHLFPTPLTLPPSLFALQVRDLQNNFFATLSQTAISMYEKYNAENSDIDNLPDDARKLLGDKELLVNALQV